MLLKVALNTITIYINPSRSDQLQDSEISFGEDTIQCLASFGCLKPQKIALSKPSDIELIATKLFVSDDNILKVTDECTWKVLSMDQSIHSLFYKRVDHFCREVFFQTTSNYTKKQQMYLRWL